MDESYGSDAILQRSSSSKRKFNHREYNQSSHSKKLRSKIPRKKRQQLSPILARTLSSLLSDDKSEVNSVFPAGSSSSSCFPDEISCASNWFCFESENASSKSSRSSSKRKNATSIRGFGDESDPDVRVSRLSVRSPNEKFRRITRLYLKQKENERATKINGNAVNADIGVELSECSCVESFSGVVDEGVFRRSDAISERNAKFVQREELEKSEATVVSTAIVNSPSEVSYKCNFDRNVGEFGVVDNDTSEREVENATDLQHYEVSYISLAESLSEPKSLNDLFPPTSEVSDRFLESITKTEPPERLISDTFDDKSEQITGREQEEIDDLDHSLACTECLSYDSSESPTVNEVTVSDQFDSEIFSHSFDDSDFSLTESQSDFSERSAENSSPPIYYPLFLQYTKQFCRLSSPLEIGASGRDNDTYLDEYTPSRFEDAEHEKSYTSFRSRERKVSAQSYAEVYCSTTECGDMILQQRFRMVNWIVEQSKVKELQGETVFLAVTLLDRFLNQGFFKNKRKLQVLGIACLTLATRIEENQPLNWQNAFHVGNNVHSKSEVIAMEWIVQKVLNFQLYFPTTFNFLWFYLKAANADAVVEKRAKYLAFMSLLDHERLCYWPSSVAAGIVILASLAANRESSCQRVMETHVRTTNDDLSECLQSLEWLVKYVC
ncbi:hypothetical protein Syun_022596 [Stephania yunnanensis]|uniref:Cyclin-like domain-containing protein n=1 Tax=Stephania yunnanensis TaxID=152371 RepID=A0AAP0F7A0_9MAGN